MSNEESPPTTFMLQKRVPGAKHGQFHFKTLEKLKFDGKIILNSFVIKTEAEMCFTIYSMHGKGTYMILAWRKGKEGYWRGKPCMCNFWKGKIDVNGFTRDKACVDWVEKECPNFSEIIDEDEFEEDYQDEVIRRENTWVEEEKAKHRKQPKGPYGITKSSPPGQRYDFEKPSKSHKTFMNVERPINISNVEDERDLSIW